MSAKTNDHDICPGSLAWVLVLGIRKWLQNPNKILKPHLREGMRALDIGCGPGFFTIPMAELVGETGSVVAVDIQKQMLDLLVTEAQKQGVSSQIEPHLANSSGFKIDQPCDFALAFFMVHEVPDKKALFRDVAQSLVPGGKLLIVEPKGHVSLATFDESIKVAQDFGFKTVDHPKMYFCRTALLQKS